MGDELEQGTELLELVKAAAGAGDLDGAQALAESIPLRQSRDQALVSLVPAWARAGRGDRAVALAERIRYPHNWGWAWALLAKATADRGDIAEALRFAARADDEARLCAVDGMEELLGLLMDVAVATGDHDRAAELADRVEEMARSRNPHGWCKPRPLAMVLAREALEGDFRRLDALLRPPSESAVRAGGSPCGWNLGEPGDQGTVLEGDLDASAASPVSARLLLGARDMACLLDTVDENADLDVALALADRAETLLETGDGRDHNVLLKSLTLLLARHGQVERAMVLTEGLDLDLSVAQQADMVGELARSGDTDGAEALAHTITDRRAHDRALIEVVRKLVLRGDRGRAEVMTRLIDDGWAQGEALLAIALGTARHGDLDAAETLTRSIACRGTRARALAALVELSEPPRARRLAAQVVVLGGWEAVLPVLERIMPRSVAVVADRTTS
ncbi:hypothetical protein [Streptomyces sp. M41(2017)]|uniref:hypothetical protein n=1 Tax=Streptomyces sp. M41(2017) TaxID=1955065 RepID=UPI00117DF45A|nr:hypothetical protein [Streptomyces sp. M41(2017)]